MFQCKDLFKLPSLSKMKIIAGNKGLHKIIRWSYKAESIHLAKWVHGGELLIISKMVIHEKDFNLYNFLKEAISLNISGALLLIGPNYIEQIPQSVIDLSNQKHFPLFLIPWDTPLVDIFEELGHAIASINLINDKHKDLLFSIIFNTNLSFDYLKYQSQEVNFSFDGYLQFFEINFLLPQSENAIILNDVDKDTICQFIHTLFENEHIPILSSSYTKNIIALINVNNTSLDTLNTLFPQILNYIKENYPNYIVNIGIGTRQKSLEKYKLSYEQASKCINLAIKQKQKNMIYYYEQLGLYQLFYDINNKTLLENFVHNILYSLMAYDKKYNTNLIQTLEVYLNKNCNLNQTAETLFIHRNTIKYRLQRIEEITNTSLNDAFTRLNFFNAILIKKFLQ
ncbi:MAG: PucR family transcriptional regulator ligand-binding domain-containing protein [Megamonas funiformis]|uniref:PucR family transcriptional regulator n=1 Tax=Megamonas funiformis TaxID=437897 RepID=UPI002A825E47|nr:PucR family transcriptional regulator ligand-binding domain-containing protein [Megamonas funiformis]MDY3874645.1 PucR family transcriptional regulator ligand-binding domain-containing protein [Megamonas funiformis]